MTNNDYEKKEIVDQKIQCHFELYLQLKNKLKNDTISLDEFKQY